MNKFGTLVSNIASFSVGMIIGASVLAGNNDIYGGHASTNRSQGKPPIEEKKKERKKIGFKLGVDDR